MLVSAFKICPTTGPVTGGWNVRREKGINPHVARYDGTPPSGPIKQIGEDGVPAKPRQRIPPNLVRQPSFPGHTWQIGFDYPNAVNDIMKLGPNEIPQEHEKTPSQLSKRSLSLVSNQITEDPRKGFERGPKGVLRDSSNSASSSVSTQGERYVKLLPNEIEQGHQKALSKLSNGHISHVSRQIAQDPRNSLERGSIGVQTDSNDSVFSSVSIQGLDLCDDATTPDYEGVTHIESTTSHPWSSSPATYMHSGTDESISVEIPEATLNLQNTIAGDKKMYTSSTLDPQVPNSKETFLCEYDTPNQISLQSIAADEETKTSSAALKLPVQSLREHFVCEGVASVSRPSEKPEISVFQSNLRCMSSGDEKFTVRELLSSANVTSPSVTSCNVEGWKSLQPDEGANLLNPISEKLAVIRHSSFRVGNEKPIVEPGEMGVQNGNVGKPINVRDKLEMRNTTSSESHKTSSCSKAASLKLNISGHSGFKELDSRSPVSSASKFYSFELTKPASPMTEEEKPAKGFGC
ncbi:serine/threonine-protein kinase Nek5 [Quillaja saponaria]|uniref:Serine/threonine-protein kinase Nek5 n=1 Tax=Quillaja saponaria TaxID=32244 RepID=A0AAD7QGV8_QUISA|nr:serine/threonine-protein kinase Nek5 [Quillaja saponaria]